MDAAILPDWAAAGYAAGRMFWLTLKKLLGS
jgi:hypothetical protein